MDVLLLSLWNYLFLSKWVRGAWAEKTTVAKMRLLSTPLRNCDLQLKSIEMWAICFTGCSTVQKVHSNCSLQVLIILLCCTLWVCHYTHTGLKEKWWERKRQFTSQSRDNIKKGLNMVEGSSKQRLNKAKKAFYTKMPVSIFRASLWIFFCTLLYLITNTTLTTETDQLCPTNSFIWYISELCTRVIKIISVIDVKCVNVS